LTEINRAVVLEIMSDDPNAGLCAVGLEHPIALAGVGSAASPTMTAAVSRAGGLGAMGCHDLTSEQ